VTSVDGAGGDVLAVLGPTASGKSALALEVARGRTAAGLTTEVVAVDAFTVYRGMDVGTAKPSEAERAEVPHHLVDVLDPGEELTVAAFQGLARASIDAILARGATPLLVGGSGLYWRAVVDPLRFPPTDAGVRAEIERRWGGDATAAHAHLVEVDPAAAARIGPGNLRRTVRALEVLALTGERFSAFDDGWSSYASRYEPLRVAYLEPEAAVLRERIHQRAEAMVAGGLLDEAAALRAGGELSRTARQAIGYAEALAVLDGEAPADELAVTIAHRTWRYARRQRSWFRADPRCQPPTTPGAARDALN
jgi:tRNA dimethylallyltransferase